MRSIAPSISLTNKENIFSLKNQKNLLFKSRKRRERYMESIAQKRVEGQVKLLSCSEELYLTAYLL